MLLVVGTSISDQKETLERLSLFIVRVLEAQRNADGLNLDHLHLVRFARCRTWTLAQFFLTLLASLIDLLNVDLLHTIRSTQAVVYEKETELHGISVRVEVVNLSVALMAALTDAPG